MVNTDVGSEVEEETPRGKKERQKERKKRQKEKWLVWL